MVRAAVLCGVVLSRVVLSVVFCCAAMCCGELVAPGGAMNGGHAPAAAVPHSPARFPLLCSRIPRRRGNDNDTTGGHGGEHNRHPARLVQPGRAEGPKRALLPGETGPRFAPPLFSSPPPSMSPTLSAASTPPSTFETPSHRNPTALKRTNRIPTTNLSHPTVPHRRISTCGLPRTGGTPRIDSSPSRSTGCTRRPRRRAQTPYPPTRPPCPWRPELGSRPAAAVCLRLLSSLSRCYLPS